jgi:hypothetical protein
MFGWFLPKPVYEALPYLYVLLAGLILWYDVNVFAVGAAFLLGSATTLVSVMRITYRRSTKPRNPYRGI